MELRRDHDTCGKSFRQFDLRLAMLIAAAVGSASAPARAENEVGPVSAGTVDIRVSVGTRYKLKVATAVPRQTRFRSEASNARYCIETNSPPPLAPMMMQLQPVTAGPGRTSTAVPRGVTEVQPISACDAQDEDEFSAPAHQREGSWLALVRPE